LQPVQLLIERGCIGHDPRRGHRPLARGGQDAAADAREIAVIVGVDDQVSRLIQERKPLPPALAQGPARWAFRACPPSWRTSRSLPNVQNRLPRKFHIRMIPVATTCTSR